ncbi:hypothetical protein ACFY8V_23695 [Streptomyces californicus]|uniref:hypothetical protein n=1 Tax=Streptomyces TaxID=1883 RepID=UPI00211D6506|nr:hypothetical protein [Streptomyces sp. sk226]
MLATAFVGALALLATSGQGTEDITWAAPASESAPAAHLALPGDITWGVQAGAGA